jgi:hypothetical protein
VLSRPPTLVTLWFATTDALVAVTHVARRLVLRSRVRPLARTPPAAVTAALVALFLDGSKNVVVRVEAIGTPEGVDRKPREPSPSSS